MNVWSQSSGVRDHRLATSLAKACIVSCWLGVVIPGGESPPSSSSVSESKLDSSELESAEPKEAEASGGASSACGERPSNCSPEKTQTGQAVSFPTEGESTGPVAVNYQELGLHDWVET